MACRALRPFPAAMPSSLHWKRCRRTLLHRSSRCRSGSSPPNRPPCAHETDMSKGLAATANESDSSPSAAARRLVLFAPNLHGGGAERILAVLASHWADQGRDVTLVTLAAATPHDFPIANTVRRVGLGLTGESKGPLSAIRQNLRRIAAIRNAFVGMQPQVIVSFIEQANILALFAARPLGVPVVISERTDPTRHRVGRIWSWLRKRTYRRCAALVVLTDEIAVAMRPIARSRPIVVIPNGVSPPSVPRLPEEQRDVRTVLGVGRLSHEKGWERLVSA